jgi:hypothetical protein
MKAIELLNESNLDYRKLNFLRLTLLKENGGNPSVTLETFLKFFQNILRISNNDKSPLLE